MSEEVDKWMKQWVDIVNKKTPQEDFWIETPVGNFKNPKLISNDNEDVGEINITIQYDVWDKTNLDEDKLRNNCKR